MKLITYQDFLKRVDELGFMSLGDRAFPALFEEVENGWANTDDPETDPWRWKDRIAQEKKAAFGCILGGHRGFVSARMYPLFLAAYQPEEAMELRRAYGKINQTTWQLWQLFEANIALSTDEIRLEMGVSRKLGGSRVDASLRELQRGYYITVAGSKRKISKRGEPYGWPSCVYETVDSWAPEDWIRGIDKIDPLEAREEILDAGMAMGMFSSRDELAEKLGFVRRKPNGR